MAAKHYTPSCPRRAAPARIYKGASNAHLINLIEYSRDFQPILPLFSESIRTKKECPIIIRTFFFSGFLVHIFFDEVGKKWGKMLISFGC